MARFTVELASKVQRRFGNNDQAQEIFEFAKEVALTSWKNGLDAGKRKSTSRVRPAVVKGSALKSGKLTPRA